MGEEGRRGELLVWSFVAGATAGMGEPGGACDGGNAGMVIGRCVFNYLLFGMMKKVWLRGATARASVYCRRRRRGCRCRSSMSNRGFFNGEKARDQSS